MKDLSNESSSGGVSVERTEREIFSELETLCADPGYIHAVAYFCFRDNLIKYTGQKAYPVRTGVNHI